MLDLFHLQGTDYNIQVFTQPNTDTWLKPKNAKLVYIISIGPGGGGGGGRADVIGSNSVGGSGGGSGAINVGLFQACVLPDRIYLNVPNGASGGASNTSGGTPSGTINIRTRVDPAGTTNRGDWIFQTFNGTGGVSNNATPTGGTGGQTFTPTTQGYLSGWGVISALSGQSGGNSSTGDGSSLTSSSFVSGGAGGGGRAANFTTYGSGGTVSTTGQIPSSIGGVSGDTINGSNGYDGMRPSSNTSISFPITFMGGAGGAPINGTGGTGGNGGIGCGGGGGGAGITSGGRGGDGGDGLVIIISI